MAGKTELEIKSVDCMGLSHISKRDGEYRLTSSEGPMEGSYKFDQKTRMLTVAGEAVGQFELYPIAPYRLPQPTEGAAANLPVIFVKKSEVMREIGDAENAGAYFVLPSQLNGAEYPSYTDIITEVEHYRHDNTGGPRGQLAGHPGCAQFVLDNAANDSRPRGVNAVESILDELEIAGIEGFKVKNGYLSVPDLGSEDKFQRAQEVWESKANQLRPLMMLDCLACGLDPSKRRFNTSKHKVSLVYASAVPVNTYNNTARNPRHEQFVKWVAHKVLQTQYYGALFHAAHHAQAGVKTRVYLMPLGGGVFRNDLESIALGMAEAVEMLTDSEREGLDIRLLAWEGNSEAQSFTRSLRGHNKLRELHDDNHVH